MSKTPKLRFKEFNGDWEKTTLKHVTYRFEYGMNSASTEFDGENKYIRITDIDENTSKYMNTNVVSPLGELEDKYLVKENDILFARTGASTGKTYLYDEKDGKLYFAGFLIRANVNSNNNAKFIFLQTKTNAYDEWVKVMSMRSGQPGINSKEYASYSFKAPSKEEQEKIASFLSLIDDKISLQSDKVEALKDYKKGIMQKIFSRELRFKDDDGSDYPEWEEKKLNKLGSTYTGLSKKKKENFGIGEAKYVVYKNVFENTIAKKKEVDLVEINEGENQNKVIKGDLLFTTSSETIDEVGMISCWNYDVNNLYLNSFCFGYRLFNLEQCSPIFMAYLLRSELYRRNISILGQGSTRYNISKNELIKMNVSIPVISEQLKIVSLLLRLENKIEKEKEKLNSLKEYKKGLLKQMFV